MRSIQSEHPPTVADHVVLRRIGVGAYGEVWMARSITGAMRAVKVVLRERFEHEKSYEREFLGLKNFEPISRGHEGLVDVLQVGRNEDCFYCVMELADSATGDREYEPLTLADLIKKKGRLDVAECARIGADVAEALAFLHRNGLVHRDVKPSNIIFVNGRPKLADIGLVTSLGAARSFVGTDGFIPPEGPGAPAGDIYGLGKTLYEMATGRSRLDFPDLPPNLEPHAFVELNEIILRACAPTPAERHRSAEELRGELLLLDAGRSIRRLRRNEKLLVVWRRVGLAAVLVMLAVGAGFSWERQRAETARREASTETQRRLLIEQKERQARENLYAADMNLAQQAIEAGNYGRAQSLLAPYLPKQAGDDLRGFEWFYYWQRVQGDSVGVLRAHDEVVSSLVLMPDGQRLLSGSFDSTIREWYLPEKREVRRWKLPGSLFSAIALDSTGTRLACEGGNRRYSSLLNLDTGAWVTNISNESPSIAFTPGDTQLARGADSAIFDTNGVVEITDLNFRVQKRLEQSGGRVLFHPNGKLMATGPWVDSIKLWTWPQLKPAGVLKGAGTAVGMSFSPDGARLASVARDGRLSVYDVASGELLKQRIVHGGAVVWSVSFSPDGRRLATGGNDQAVRTWHATSLEEDHVYRGHGSEVWSVIWSKSGDELFSAGKDATIRIWTAHPPQPLSEIPDVAQRPVFSGNNRMVASRSRNGGAVIWELPSGKLSARIDDAIEVGGFSEDQTRLIVLGRDGQIQERDVKSGAKIDSRGIPEITQNFAKRAMSKTGRWIASGYRNGEVTVINGASGTSITLAGHKEMIIALAFSADEKWLLTGGIDRTARLWDLASGKQITIFTNHKMGVGALAFSADGRQIATGSWDDTLHIWDRESGRELMVLGGHDGGVQAVDFAPDGRTLFCLTGTSILKIWNLPAQREAGQVRLRPGVHQAWLSVSPNGEWLAAVSQAEAMSLLNAPREKVSTSR